MIREQEPDRAGDGGAALFVRANGMAACRVSVNTI